MRDSNYELEECRKGELFNIKKGNGCDEKDEGMSEEEMVPQKLHIKGTLGDNL